MSPQWKLALLVPICLPIILLADDRVLENHNYATLCLDWDLIEEQMEAAEAGDWEAAMPPGEPECIDLSPGEEMTGPLETRETEAMELTYYLVEYDGEKYWVLSTEVE